MTTIADLKEQYPDYAEVDDKVLADALYNKFYSESVSKNDFLQRVGLEPEGTELGRGLKRGTETTKALVSEGAPGVGKGLANDLANFFGFDDVAEPQRNLEEYQRKVEQAYKDYPTSTPSFKDIEGIVDAGDYIAATAGEQLPQLGLSLLGGGVSGIATKTAVKELAKRGGKELTKGQLDKALNRGILAGTVGTSATQNIPESYFNLLEQGEDAATSAVIVGSFKAGLDALPQIKILEKILGPKAADIVGDSLLKKIGKQGLVTGAQEGVTEAAQEGLDIIAEQFIIDNAELFTPENLDNGS